MPGKVRIGRYRHYKGREYRVMGVAEHTESGEQVVVYQQLYGDHRLWVRPLKIFHENVEVDGNLLPRFSFISSD